MLQSYWHLNCRNWVLLSSSISDIAGTSQTEEATGGSEVPLEIENDGLQEDTSLQSVASDVTEKLPNGHPEVEIGDSESRSIESGDGNAVTASKFFVFFWFSIEVDIDMFLSYVSCLLCSLSVVLIGMQINERKPDRNCSR